MQRVLAVALGSLLLLPACGATEQRPAGDGAVLHRYGIAFEVPEGWDATITHGAVRAANFPLPPTPGKPLAEGQLLLQLFETDPEADSPPAELSLFTKLAEVPGLAEDDFHAPEPGTQLVAGQASRTFSVSDRLFVLFVGSGTKVPSPPALDELDQLLTTMSIEPGDFYPGSVDPARFAPRDGWHIGDSRPGPVMAHGNFESAWASTIPYRDTWNALPPQRTLGALPGDGIVIWVGLTTSNRFALRGRDVTQPLRLVDFERHSGWEGQVRDLPQYLLRAKVDDEYEVEARVYFGRPVPTPAMEDEADAMLAGLRLPDWPHRDY